MSEKIEAELIDNFLIVWNPEEGSKLHSMGFYGKPIGIPKPKTSKFEVPLILDLIEGLYLVEKGILHVYREEKEVGVEELRELAKRLYEEFDTKYAVYKHLRDNGLVVLSGIKFGCDFAVYRKGPGLEHAPYIISVKNYEDEIDAADIIRAGRLATTVRKRFIVSVPKGDGEIEYLIFEWFRA